jgi:hypothetical protein
VQHDHGSLWSYRIFRPSNQTRFCPKEFTEQRPNACYAAR